MLNILPRLTLILDVVERWGSLHQRKSKVQNDILTHSNYRLIKAIST